MERRETEAITRVVLEGFRTPDQESPGTSKKNLELNLHKHL